MKKCHKPENAERLSRYNGDCLALCTCHHKDKYAPAGREKPYGKLRTYRGKEAQL